MSSTRIRIGTRGSNLALRQAAEVKRLLVLANEIEEREAAIIPISTAGDRVQDRPLREIGGKGVFCKEIEAALLDGEIDVAVHSMKDLPVQQPDGLVVDCVIPREDHRDALVSRRHSSLMDMTSESVVGTSSVRRRAQLKHAIPGIEVIEFRGNVETRIRKLESGMADATLLAMAGLKRLGSLSSLVHPIPESLMLPAPAQGAICLERRKGDRKIAKLANAINDPGSFAATASERAFLAEMGGDCFTPVAALATIDGHELVLGGELLLPDGSNALSGSLRGTIDDGVAIGKELARRILSRSTI